METVSEGPASCRAFGSRKGCRESPYKPYTPKEPSTCKSKGWRKDTHHIYTWHLSMANPEITSEDAERAIGPVLDHMWLQRARW